MGLPSVGFVSLGCAKNLVDSEHLATMLRAEGLPLARSPAAADVVLVNTCAFVGDAKRESVAAILAACERKAAGRCRAVVVAGCLPQRYRGALRAALPEVDAFLGLDELERVGAVVRCLARGARPAFAIRGAARRLFEPRPGRVLLSGGPFAYLKIAEGCNHRCAFCAIPMIRGRYRSRPLPAVVREAEDLLARGVRELNLIAQDSTAYGSDRGERDGLARLLRALGRIGGRFWIRVLYAHPCRLSPPVLDAVGDVPQVCRYLDVPVQHSHPDVLRAMRRAGSAAAVRALPWRLRAALPGVTLRTTALVGFPGETEAHVRDLLDYVRDARFEHLGAFGFSREEGTAAWGLPRRVPARVVQARRDRVMRAQRAIVRRRARDRIGQTDVVLLERCLTGTGADRGWVGRSAAEAPEVDGGVRVRAGPDARAGDFVRVRYTAAAGYDMEAVALAARGRPEA